MNPNVQRLITDLMRSLSENFSPMQVARDPYAQKFIRALNNRFSGNKRYEDDFERFKSSLETTIQHLASQYPVGKPAEFLKSFSDDLAKLRYSDETFLQRMPSPEQRKIANDLIYGKYTVEKQKYRELLLASGEAPRVAIGSAYPLAMDLSKRPGFESAEAAQETFRLRAGGPTSADRAQFATDALRLPTVFVRNIPGDSDGSDPREVDEFLSSSIFGEVPALQNYVPMLLSQTDEGLLTFGVGAFQTEMQKIFGVPFAHSKAEMTAYVSPASYAFTASSCAEFSLVINEAIPPNDYLLLGEPPLSRSERKSAKPSALAQAASQARQSIFDKAVEHYRDLSSSELKFKETPQGLRQSEPILSVQFVLTVQADAEGKLTLATRYDVTPLNEIGRRFLDYCKTRPEFGLESGIRVVDIPPFTPSAKEGESAAPAGAGGPGLRSSTASMVELLGGRSPSADADALLAASSETVNPGSTVKPDAVVPSDPPVLASSDDEDDFLSGDDALSVGSRHTPAGSPEPEPGSNDKGPASGRSSPGCS